MQDAKCQHFSLARMFPSDATRQALQQIGTLKGTTLPSVLYSFLQGMIMSGEIEPRQKVNELAIAQKLGVSRGPVREACRQLLQAGLLTFEAQRGFSVRGYSIAETEELVVVRTQLAELVGRMAAVRASAATLSALDEILQAMRSAAQTRHRESYYGHSFLFYQKVCEVTGNGVLKDLYLDLHCRIRLFRLETQRMVKRAGGNAADEFAGGITRRERLLAALRGGNPEEAARVMRTISEESFAVHRRAREQVERAMAMQNRRTAV
jgi:DNA-binding GntR family transcriptional regulator